MLFITQSAGATWAKNYYTRQLAPSDYPAAYYTKDATEMPGQWHGLGAELLGLNGEVQQKDFFALCDNLDPQSGKNLTRNTQANRRTLYDFTFDAPKSVSLAYEVGNDERVLSAFQSSVSETMAEMEGAMMTRVRANGADEDRVTSNMVWAGFTHRTTRPVDGAPDPQLHMHATVFNATYDTVEGKWKAAQFSNLVRDKGYYQAAFHSRLAEKLSDLGYGIERDGNSFRLAGIGKDVTDRFSRRTEIIESEAQRLGITNQKAKGELGRRTREKKEATPKSMPALREVWKARLSPAETESILAARDGKQGTSPDAAKAVDYALSHCFERASAVPETELLKTALIQSVGNASVREIRSEMGRENVIGRERQGIRYATTKEVLREELAMTAFVRDGRGKFGKLGGTAAPELDPALSKEQHDAALVILGSRDRVTALKGGAGTGKTRMMQATVKAVESAGTQVFTFAPSAEASRGVLRSEGFENAETVERLLIDPEMQKTVKNQLLWVDEAGLLSVRDMKRLFDVANEQNARIVLSGDTNQHNAVYRGDALRILEKDAGMKTGELKEIRRQTNASYREAVKAISEGDRVGKDGKTRLEAGIEILDGMGAIKEMDGDALYRKIADDYATVTHERKADGTPKSALVVSPTHKEAERVTDAIRDALKEDGRVGLQERTFTALRPLNLTEAQRQDAREYVPGSVVQFHQNARGFKRSERLTIAGSDENGVRAERADGSAVMLPLTEAKRFQIYRTEEVALAEGDRLRITQNGFTGETRRGVLVRGKNRLNNGSVYDVAGFTRQGDIKLSNGFVVHKNYGGISHGYVVTSHASQGRTVDTVLLAVGQESFVAANKEQFYVSVSRGREAVRLYTDDKAAMLDAVKGSAARLSASELMGKTSVKAKPHVPVMQRLFKVQQIQRAYRAVRDRVAASWSSHSLGEVQGHVGIER
jgi:conjugative relaxase-like TrwC/TraI family protein